MSQGTKLDENLISHSLQILEDEYKNNSDFNESFDDEPIQIGRLEFEKSRTLYWLDSEAYAEAKYEWQNQLLLDKHNDVLKLLKANKDITSFKELVNSIKRKKIVPFVGAGLSQPMNIPLWKDALNKIYARIQLDDNSILKMIKSDQFLEAAQKLTDHDSVMSNNLRFNS